MAVVNDWSGQTKKENIPQLHQILYWITMFSTAHMREAFLLESEGSPMKTAYLVEWHQSSGCIAGNSQTDA